MIGPILVAVGGGIAGFLIFGSLGWLYERHQRKAEEMRRLVDELIRRDALAPRYAQQWRERAMSIETVKVLYRIEDVDGTCYSQPCASLVAEVPLSVLLHDFINVAECDLTDE